MRTKEFELTIKRIKEQKQLHRWSIKAPIYKEAIIKAVSSTESYEQFVNSARGIDIFFNMTFALNAGVVQLDADLNAAMDILADGIFVMEDLSYMDEERSF